MKDINVSTKLVLLSLCLMIMTFISVAGSESLTLNGCLRGSGCSQCPRSRYTVDEDGEILCCQGCTSAILYYGKNPSDWCVCYIDSTTDAASKTLKFPGGSTSRFPSDSGTGGSSSGHIYGQGQNNKNNGISDGKLRDALFVINNGNPRNGEVSQAVHRAITLMANTIEDINLRLIRLENIILQSGLQNHITDRVGAGENSLTPGSSSSSENTQGTIPPSPNEGRPCPSKNFTRIGRACYYVSAWKDHRAVWQKASQACENMGAILAEPVSTDFDAITQYLSLAASTTGYSYWIGGLYLGTSPWRWSYSQKPVTSDSAYWIGVDANGKPVTPGDPTPGRCLSFSYLTRTSNYYYAADQCGFEKYFVCQLHEKSHRRI